MAGSPEVCWRYSSGWQPGPSGGVRLPLTELGRSQAENLAARLAGEPIAAVYASQAVRAQQTAAPLAARFGLDVQAVEIIRRVEANLGRKWQPTEKVQTKAGRPQKKRGRPIGPPG